MQNTINNADITNLADSSDNTSIENKLVDDTPQDNPVDDMSENTENAEHIDVKDEDANTTNCLALTIQKEHKLVAVKNVFLRSIRMSWKVVVSTVTLWIIKMLS